MCVGLSDVNLAGGLGSEIVEQWKRHWLQNCGTLCYRLGWFGGFQRWQPHTTELFALELFFRSMLVSTISWGCQSCAYCQPLITNPNSTIHRPIHCAQTVRAWQGCAHLEVRNCHYSWTKIGVSMLVTLLTLTSILALTRKLVCTSPAFLVAKWDALESSPCFLVGSPPFSRLYHITAEQPSKFPTCIWILASWLVCATANKHSAWMEYWFDGSFKSVRMQNCQNWTCFRRETRQNGRDLSLRLFHLINDIFYDFVFWAHPPL